MIDKFKLFISFLFILILSSCGSVKEGFTMKKKENSDEFLVEKKSPLIMPPNYKELPIPKEGMIIKDDENKEIKTLIDETNSKNFENTKKTSKTFEESLLEKIRNN